MSLVSSLEIIICVYVFLMHGILFSSALEESMPHLRVLLGSQNPSERRGGDMGNMKLRWKVLFSNLVYAISSQQHPIALVFEDLHWADEDTFG